ncbi:MAG TPA: glycerophosphodiester phosphodiesterase [Planctomycetota bacterium]|nr:glycerophosphodiester phosphodiesterase [Planctomycetota bacterium]
MSGPRGPGERGASSAALLPRFLGHRGARGSAPENTLVSLRRAAELGAPWVEFDVKLTADGRAILMHDETLERTTSGSGPVAAASWERIRQLDAGAWFGPAFTGERVPDLEQAIALLAGLGLGANVEIKPCPGREAETGAAVAREVARLWPASLPPAVLSSFSEDSLAAARDAAPEVLRGLLVTDIPPDWPERLSRLACVSLHAGERQLLRPAVEAVKRRGVPMLAYTVNTRERAQALWSWGVDCVATDWPERLTG